MRRFGHEQGLAETGVGQHEIVIDLEQPQWLTQPIFAFTWGRATPSHRCHALA